MLFLKIVLFMFACTAVVGIPLILIGYWITDDEYDGRRRARENGRPEREKYKYIGRHRYAPRHTLSGQFSKPVVLRHIRRAGSGIPVVRWVPAPVGVW